MTTIRVEDSVPMTMRDGVQLRADIYRPDDRERHPAILMRSPYSRTMTVNGSFMNLLDTMAAGYVLVVQSLRGTFDSGGEMKLGDVTMAGEALDGYDSVEWVAAQPWCDGNVGTAGGSYLGMLQWITARENPPHLKAMAPWISGSGGTEPSRQHGVVNLGVALNWVLAQGLEIAKWQQADGKDMAKAVEMLTRGNVVPEEVYNYLPLKDVPHFNFQGIKEVWENRIFNTDAENPDYVEKTRTRYEKVTVPCFHVSGWYDFYPSGTLGHFQTMQANGGSELARRSQHILMGPWLHGGPATAGSVGDMGFGETAGVLGSRPTQSTLLRHGQQRVAQCGKVAAAGNGVAAVLSPQPWRGTHLRRERRNQPGGAGSGTAGHVRLRSHRPGPHPRLPGRHAPAPGAGRNSGAVTERTAERRTLLYLGSAR